MAEAFCRAMGGNVECASAGSHPEREVAPETVAVLREIGIDISGARPKGFAELPDLKFDYLVTMGCEVNCPYLPGAKRIEWQIPDPKGKGIEEYRRVREMIRKEIEKLLKQIREER